MLKLEILTESTASESAAPMMSGIKKRLGFVPNLFGVIANSPIALKAYSELTAALSETSFTPVEQHVIAVAVSHANGCTYCTAAHGTILKMVGADAATISAVAEGRAVPDPKLEALRQVTTKMVTKRGWLDDAEDIRPFLAAGYRQEQLLEILIGVALKTISNYTNHIAKTPIDPQFGG